MSEGWETKYRGNTSSVDVLPVDDLLEHEDSNDCPCSPTIERVNGGKGPFVCIHNSWRDDE